MTVVAGSKLMNNYGQRSLEMVRGDGAYLYDQTGKQYLDFTAGIAVCNLGHAHPSITETISRQAATLIHCSNLYLNPEQQRLARSLSALSGLDEVFFCNSGTEANEAAIKLARKYAAFRQETQRTRIVSLPNAFHGRTFGSLSITPKPAYQAGYAPLVPDCVAPTELAGVLDLIDEHTAACFVEVIQGEGGVRPLSQDLLVAIEQRCRDTGALFVIDEVQTGVGRTGSFYAFEQLGLHPDIVTMAKGLANGMPIGAVLAKSEVAQAFGPGSHGSTFGGNPLVTAVANVVCEIVSQPQFLSSVVSLGERLEQVLNRLGTEVTGRGLMWGMTVSDAKQYVAKAAERGVLLTAVGDTRVRFVPPLILTHEQIAEMERRLADLE
ncbi:MAG: acetylornithine aminotransferase [Alicyclobacillus sp. RIFOXYA1_FULL_53_8]|nr:MAG: acetylornithine aminotransferase [Alicyclobacillus sp. RIFOXYA1_FULL_53_8]